MSKKSKDYPRMMYKEGDSRKAIKIDGVTFDCKVAIDADDEKEAEKYGWSATPAVNKKKAKPKAKPKAKK